MFNSKKDFYIFIFVVISVAVVPVCGYYITRGNHYLPNKTYSYSTPNSTSIK